MKKFLYLLVFGFLSINCSSEPEIPVYTLSVTAQDGGTVSQAGGSFEEGTSVTITATPNPGYTFTGWSNGSTENPIVIYVNENLNLEANFINYVNEFKKDWGSTIWTIIEAERCSSSQGYSPERTSNIKFVLSSTVFYSGAFYSDWTNLINNCDRLDENTINWINQNFVNNIEKGCFEWGYEDPDNIISITSTEKDKLIRTMTSKKTQSKKITEYVVYRNPLKLYIYDSGTNPQILTPGNQIVGLSCF